MTDVELELSETSTPTSTPSTEPYINLEAVSDGTDNVVKEEEEVQPVNSINTKGDGEYDSDSDSDRKPDGIVSLNEETVGKDGKVKPKTAKEILKKTILPTKGKYFSYFFGLAFDIVGLIIWLCIVLLLLDPVEREETWYMPLIGVIGATIAMATPAGGGVFYFPFLTTFKLTPEEAVAFNIATVTISMGIFGTASWVRKSRSSIIVWIVAVIVPAGWIGTLFSIYLPITRPLPLRIIFLVFCFFLLVYIIFILWKGFVYTDTKKYLDWRNPRNVIAVIVTGLVGGVVVGYIGVGIDMLIFLVLNAFYKIDSRTGTGTSILVMGWTAAFPFWFHLFYFKNVPITLWVMALGGCIVGARLGVLINKLFGRRNMMILFGLLLLAEVIRTPIELTLFPPNYD